MKNATSKLRKKSFTIVEQACHNIPGFRKFYDELRQKIVLSGQSVSTLTNYGHNIAQISLHFRKLPQNISEKEINRYLAELARNSKTPSLSQFKHTIYGLRYCYHFLGMNEKAVKLPSLRQEPKTCHLYPLPFGHSVSSLFAIFTSRHLSTVHIC